MTQPLALLSLCPEAGVAETAQPLHDDGHTSPVGSRVFGPGPPADGLSELCRLGTRSGHPFVPPDEVQSRRHGHIMLEPVPTVHEALSRT